MISIDFKDVILKIKKGNKILFDRNSPSLQKLLELIRIQNRRTLVLWAFKFIEDIKVLVEPLFPNDQRISVAIHLCKEWAAGREKMPKAKKALLNVHAMAKEIEDQVIIAKLHAIGQGLATIHVETHAIGLAIYDLTSIVLEHGVDNFQEAVNKRIKEYIDILNQCSVDINQIDLNWASFLLRDDIPNKEMMLYQKRKKLI